MFVLAYKTIGSTHMGGQCRFQPSCSDYAIDALRIHPPVRAISLISRRLLRCRPLGPYGHDPVPSFHGGPRAES